MDTVADDPARRIARSVLAAPARLGPVRVLAIDGPSGSGKSTLARRVTDRLVETGAHTVLISTDDFATWDDPVAWWPRLACGVLDRLAAGVPGRYRRTEWSDGTPHPGARVTVPVPDVLVLEGVSAGRASIRPRLSRLVWAIDADPVTRLERAVARDGEWSRPFLVAWQRFEHGWFAVDRPDRHADDTIGLFDADEGR